MKADSRLASVKTLLLHIGGTLVALAFACGSAQAQSKEAEPSIFSLHGFGTVGLVHSSEKKADFINSDFQKRGAGYSRSWSAEVDSLVGVQLDARFDSQVSAVMQVVSEQRHDGSYDPQIEWANLKYEITPDFSVRAGRFVLGAFMQADSRKVGYAYPWVRPPVEVYNLLPATRTDGIDAIYRTRFGNVKNTVELGIGRGSGRVPEAKVKWKDGWGVIDTLEYDHVTVHVSYLNTKQTIGAYKPYFDMFRQFGPQGVALADKYDVDNKTIKFFSAGVSYDPGKWFMTGEWGKTDFHSILGKRKAWFVSSGFRTGQFTPYVTYSRAIIKSSTYDPGLTLPSGLPPLIYVQAAGMNTLLNQQLSAAPDQRSAGIGVRWDFARNGAFKLQYDHIRLGDNSSGTLDNMQPGFRLGGKLDVISATLNFLF